MFTAYLKQIATDKLRGWYKSAALGAAIYNIPIYIISLLNALMIAKGMGYGLVASVIGTVLNLFVVDVLMVGYLRSLLKKNDGAENYDVNIVLSGYQTKFKNTLKILFSKRLYLWGWELLTLLPFLVLAGAVAFISPTEDISHLAGMSVQLMQSPTEEMVLNIYEFISHNCSYILVAAPVAWLMVMFLCVPYIRKSYEYQMIPMLVCENPDISRKEAFAATKSIMKGYKFRYFCLQLSFVWAMLLCTLAMSVTGSEVAYYAVNALLMPYIYMTYLQFYISRTRVDIGVNPETENLQNI